jgi:hypothetical protein
MERLSAADTAPAERPWVLANWLVSGWCGAGDSLMAG